MPLSAGNLALARHVRDRVFRLEDLCRLLPARVSLNAFAYCVHRVNHYGVLSFSWGEEGGREAARYLRLVETLWPRLSLAQRFETAISLAKLQQRRPDPRVFAFLRQFLLAVRLERCRNYTFNQLMHLAIILSSREVFYRCLALAAAAQPRELLPASRLALAKNLSKFALLGRAREAEETFRRYLADLPLEPLGPSELLGLHASLSLLLRKFPALAALPPLLARLDRRLARLALPAEQLFRLGLAKALAGSRGRPALFLLKWLEAAVRAPPSFSRHAALAEALPHLSPALLTPALLAYFLCEQCAGERAGETLARLQRLVFTAENAYLLQLLPATPFASLAERLRLLAEDRGLPAL